MIGVFANRRMQWAVLLSLLGVLAVVYLPFANQAFGTLPLGVEHLAWVVPAALAPAVVAEIGKRSASWNSRHSEAHLRTS